MGRRMSLTLNVAKFVSLHEKPAEEIAELRAFAAAHDGDAVFELFNDLCGFATPHVSCCGVGLLFEVLLDHIEQKNFQNRTPPQAVDEVMNALEKYRARLHDVPVPSQELPLAAFSLAINDNIPIEDAIQFIRYDQEAKAEEGRLADELAAIIPLKTPMGYITPGKPVPLDMLVEMKQELLTSYSAAEIALMLEDLKEQGEIGAAGHDLVLKAMTFGALRVREVMVPRVQVVFVSTDTTPRELERLVVETGNSRFPVYDGDPGVGGFVHAKDLLGLEQREWDRRLPRRIIRPLMAVPESAGVADLESELRRNRSQIALVVDEHGSPAGIDTMEDLAEELVGDLNHNFRQILIKARKQFGLIALSDQERIEQLDNISVEDIREFHDATHHKGNMRFVISGNVESRAGEIEDIFGGLKLAPGKRFPMPDETPKAYDDVYYIEKPDLQNIYFFFNTFAKRDFTQAEDDAINLVNVMLTATLHSRILGEARERGLAYHIASNFTKLKGSTGWWFGAELTPDNSTQVFEIIVRELTRLKDGVLDDADLKAAKQFSLGKFQRSAQTVSGILGGYSAGYFFDGRTEDFFGFPERIQKIEKQQIIEVVRSLFSDNTWGLTVMGTEQSPLAKKLNEQLSVLWQ